MLPLTWWNLFATSCYNHCSCITIFILNIGFMIPLFWRNNTIERQIHSNSFSIFILYIRIMIIFFIWYSSIHSIIKCLCSISIFIPFRIFILFILPFLWNRNTIIPKIITYSLIIFIF